VGVSGLELCLTNCSWLDTKVLWACLGWNCAHQLQLAGYQGIVGVSGYQGTLLWACLGWNSVFTLHELCCTCVVRTKQNL
jgi:hypothetical protein